MTKSTTFTLADEVVEALNDETFSQSFTAARLTVPMFTLQELASLKVSVVPRGRAKEIETRGVNAVQHKLELGFQKRLTNVNDPSESDPMDLLVEQVEDFLLGTQINGKTCVAIEHILADDSLFAKEHIYADKVYTAVVEVTFLDR